jgi:predicted GIY-YIG superfamily endonuclease
VNKLWYPKQHNSKISEKDANFICDNYGILSIKQMTKLFKVCKKTIETVLRKNNISFLKKYYTYEEVMKAALKYNTQKDFEEKDYNLYTIARRRGIIDHLKKIKHFKNLGSYYKKFIYIYFLTNNRIYVGQTCNLKRRHKEHIKSWLNESELVNKKVSKLLEVNRATRLEETLRQRYIKLGYTVLNKTKCYSTGSRLKWTFNACFEDAKLYNSKKEWEIKSRGAYTSALKNGWVNKCSLHFTKTQTRPVKNIKTGEIFQSASEASRFIGREYSAVTISILRKTKCNGQTFVYLTPEEIAEWKGKQHAS